MATFAANIGNGNGYTSRTVQISGVTSQSAALRAFQSQYPGANISAVRMISSKD